MAELRQIALRHGVVLLPHPVDEHAQQEPHLDQDRQHIDLRLLEIGDAAVAADDREGRPLDVPGRLHELGDGIGQILDQRSVHQVTEIDDAGQGAVVTDEDIVGMDVAMDHLGAQTGEPG